MYRGRGEAEDEGHGRTGQDRGEKRRGEEDTVVSGWWLKEVKEKRKRKETKLFEVRFEIDTFSPFNFCLAEEKSKNIWKKLLNEMDTVLLHHDPIVFRSQRRGGFEKRNTQTYGFKYRPENTVL